MVLTRCPYEELPPGIWYFLDLVEDAEHGWPPVAGGVLDQALSFTQGRRIVRAEKAHYKLLATKRLTDG